MLQILKFILSSSIKNPFYLYLLFNSFIILVNILFPLFNYFCQIIEVIWIINNFGYALGTSDYLTTESIDLIENNSFIFFSDSSDIQVVDRTPNRSPIPNPTIGGSVYSEFALSSHSSVYNSSHLPGPELDPEYSYDEVIRRYRERKLYTLNKQELYDLAQYMYKASRRNKPYFTKKELDKIHSLKIEILIELSYTNKFRKYYFKFRNFFSKFKF